MGTSTVDSCATMSDSEPAVGSAARKRMSRDSRLAAPVFIFGLPRSGTTFMFNLLNEHPRIRMTSEGRTIREGAYLYAKYRRRRDREGFARLLEAFCEAEGDEPLNRWLVRQMRTHGPAFFQRHGQAGDFASLIRDLYTYGQDIACWGDKNVHVVECANMLRLWPDARCVILVRDPRAVYASMAAYFGTRIKYAAVEWNLHARWTRAHATDAQRFLVVRYEDLVTDTRFYVEKIFRWLGVWDPEAADRVLCKSPPIVGGLTRWRRTLQPSQVERIESYCYDEMQRWGYRPERVVKPVRIGPVGRAFETVCEHAGRIRLDPRWWRRKRLFSRFLRIVYG